MPIQEKQLGQARDNDTNTHSIYSPAANTTAVIRTIMIANNTAGAVAIRLFIDDDGTTYDQSTTILYDYSVAANTTEQINGFFAMNDATGNFAYQQGAANACTVTIFGVEIT